jgi:hypothetical protein
MFWLSAKKLLFNERHIFVRVEQVWLVASGSRHYAEIRGSRRICVKGDKADTEYLALVIRAARPFFDARIYLLPSPKIEIADTKIGAL